MQLLFATENRSIVCLGMAAGRMAAGSRCPRGRPGCSSKGAVTAQKGSGSGIHLDSRCGSQVVCRLLMTNSSDRGEVCRDISS